MIRIEDKLMEIKDIVSAVELKLIENKMNNPQVVICPLNKRYFKLPMECVGYKYICEYLDRSRVECNHPERK